MSAAPSPSSLGKTAAAIAAVLLSVLVLYVFLPTLAQGWAPLDDDFNFLANPHYRGFSAENLRWMWTARLGGHYIPLSWMSLAADHELSGMAPRGYHRTNLLLHLSNALLFFVLAWRLLGAAAEAASEPRARLHARALAAFTAAAFFALHPLRVESVAWITERRDLLCGLFCLLSVHAYLSQAGEQVSRRQIAFGLALSAFAAALLSKGIAIVLPLAFIALDVVPLRRLDLDPRLWFGQAARPVLWEKLPFVVLSAIFAATSLWAAAPVLAAGGQADVEHRLLAAGFGLSFYLEKTLLPIAIPFQLPAIAPLSLATDPWVALRGVAFLAVLGAAIAVWIRRRQPAIALALLVFTAFVLPVSGLLQAGPQLAAHRYTYLSCLPLALLLGAVVRDRTLRPRGRERAALAALVLILGVGLAALGRAQVAPWRDEVTFHRAAVEAAPLSWAPVGALARALVLRNEPVDALQVLREGRQRMPGAILLSYLEAMILATSPEKEIRDGSAALDLAGRAARATGYRDPAGLLALAAAAAETGDAATAERLLESALALTRGGVKPELSQALATASRDLSRKGYIRFSSEEWRRFRL